MIYMHFYRIIPLLYQSSLAIYPSLLLETLKRIHIYTARGPTSSFTPSPLPPEAYGPPSIVDTADQCSPNPPS
jgi:hypothetical protein